MEAFNQLTQGCSNKVRPLLVGVYGDEFQLRSELRRAKVNYLGVMAAKEVLQAVGEVPATPWTGGLCC